MFIALGSCKKKKVDNTQSWKLSPGPRADVGQEHNLQRTRRREEGQGKKEVEKASMAILQELITKSVTVEPSLCHNSRKDWQDLMCGMGN